MHGGSHWPPTVVQLKPIVSEKLNGKVRGVKIDWEKELTDLRALSLQVDTDEKEDDQAKQMMNCGMNQRKGKGVAGGSANMAREVYKEKQRADQKEMRDAEKQLRKNGWRNLEKDW